MHWAARRRFTIVAIIVAVVLVVLAVSLFSTLYKAPSCVDNKQNQDETGIDCGGSCPYLCTVAELPPVAPAPRLLVNASGRVDLVATVSNRNNAAATRNIAYTINVYNADLSFVKKVSGTLDLPPRATVPIFIPGIVASGAPGMRASLEIATSTVRWFALEKDTRIVPRVEVRSPSGTTAAPRIEATLVNPSLTMLTNVRAIVFVHDSTTGNVVAASQTVVPTIPVQGRANATFTWNEPFAAASVTVEVLPVIPMQGPVR